MARPTLSSGKFDEIVEIAAQVVAGDVDRWPDRSLAPAADAAGSSAAALPRPCGLGVQGPATAMDSLQAAGAFSIAAAACAATALSRSIWKRREGLFLVGVDAEHADGLALVAHANGEHGDDAFALGFLRDRAREGRWPCCDVFDIPVAARATWSISALLSRTGPLLMYSGERLWTALMTSSSCSPSIRRRDAALVSMTSQTSSHRALEHVLQVASVGEHHGDVVDGRQLVDALAELEFLIAEPGDGVGQEEEELDGGGLGWRRAQELAGRVFDLLQIDAELFGQGGEASFVDLRDGIVGGHADRAQTLIVDHDRRDVFATFALGAVLLGFDRFGDGALAFEEFLGGRGLGEHLALRVGDGGFDVGDGGKAVLDLLQRREVHKIRQL